MTDEVKWTPMKRSRHGALYTNAYSAERGDFLWLCQRGSDPNIMEFDGPFTRWCLFYLDSCDAHFADLPLDLTDEELKATALTLFRLCEASR